MPQYDLVLYRGKYAVTWRGDGTTKRHSLRTADKAVAEGLFARWVKEQERPQTLTVAGLWGLYAREKGERRITGNMGHSGKSILAFFGNLHPGSITAKMCREYAQQRRETKDFRCPNGRSDGTIWTELNHLRIVMAWAHKARHIDHPPHIELPRKPDPRTRRLTRNEAHRLIKAAEPLHVKVAITLMLTTAARVGAILDLTWPQVDLRTEMVSYPDPLERGKRKGRAIVPLNGTAISVLSDAKRVAMSDYVVEWKGEKVTTIRRAFMASMKRAGLTNVTPHVLRHTAACLLAESGEPMSVIANYLGHSDSSITERVYARYSPTYLRKASKSLEFEEVTSGSPERAGHSESA